MKIRSQHMTFPTGVDLLHDPRLNKGTAFTAAERQAFGLRGLLPPHIHTMADQLERVMGNFRRKPNDLEKYIFLVALQDRNETLFYRVLCDHIEEMMPIVYTPTVGQACQAFGHIFRRPRGLFVAATDIGHLADVLRNWPYPDVKVIVVTDGERILGLGDLGADGMGIPIGKLSLYVACAGIPIEACLPITLDVGTNNERLLADPLYIGLKQRRLAGAAYDEFMEEFVSAVTDVFPHALLQLEDFGNQNAFRLLQRYRDRICTFDDDIQGTGAVALAALYTALRLTGGALADQRLLFLGAGEAGIGIADLVVNALEADGLSTADARRHCWFVDSQGLVVGDRQGLAPHKLRYAHQHAGATSFLAAVQQLRPTAIIGVSGQPGQFNEGVVRAMAELNTQPIILALSNPTSKSECTAADAYAWTDGRCIFASGSPFPPVELNGRQFVPGQGNNAYIFPGVGLGVLVSEARRVTDEMFLVAARSLAAQVSDADLAIGRVYPALSCIRDVSQKIAAAVAACAWARGLAGRAPVDDIPAAVRDLMFEPEYSSYI